MVVFDRLYCWLVGFWVDWLIRSLFVWFDLCFVSICAFVDFVLELILFWVWGLICVDWESCLHTWVVLLLFLCYFAVVVAAVGCLMFVDGVYLFVWLVLVFVSACMLCLVGVIVLFCVGYLLYYLVLFVLLLIAY